ncbi:MAG: hypothetical protein RIR88_50, partial [Actinomycetota bacterium]
PVGVGVGVVTALAPEVPNPTNDIPPASASTAAMAMSGLRHPDKVRRRFAEFFFDNLDPLGVLPLKRAA